MESDCDKLVLRTCGPGGECGDAGWCKAATLLQEQDEDGGRCLAALAEDGGYPPCDLLGQELVTPLRGDCAALVDHVCGEEATSGQRPCDGQPACENAQLLATPSPRGDAGGVDTAAVPDAGGLPTVEDLCAAALREAALFPRCEA